MRFCRVLYLMVPVLFSGLACSPGGPVDVAGPAYSAGFLKRVEPHAEFKEALALIDKGACAEALPLLNLYVSQKQEPGIVQYLLGRAYMCSGDYLKGALHLRRALDREVALAREVHTAALAAAGVLSKKLAASSARSFESLKAVYTLFSLSESATLTREEQAVLGVFCDRLLGRGEYQGGLEVVRLMTRLGAPPHSTLARHVHALARLGHTDEVKTLGARVRDELGERSGAPFYEAALTAEKSFRPDLAAFLYEMCEQSGCENPAVCLDIARCYLKAEAPDKAQSAYKRCLTDAAPEQRVQRYGKVARLLQKYERIDEALEVLESGKKEFPEEFSFYLSLALLEKKSPEKVNGVDQLNQFLASKKYSGEALESVGDALLERKLRETGDAVFKQAGEKGGAPDLVHFYRGCFAHLDSKSKAAFSLFDKAVKSAQNRAEMLSRVAGYLSDSGDAQKAEAYLEKALKMDPGAVDVLLELADLKENRKASQGVRLVEKGLSSLDDKAEALVKIASWCEKRGYRTRALAYAGEGAQKETSGTVEAHLFYARLLLGEHRFDEAVKVYSEAAGQALDAPAFATQLFKDTGPVDDSRLACFAYGTAVPLLADGTLDAALVEPAAVASIRCGKPDRALLGRAIFEQARPAATIRRLLQVTFDEEAVRVVMAVVSSSGKTDFDDPGLAADLAVLFAAGGLADQALLFARQYARTTQDDAGKMQRIARTILFRGASQAAGHIMEAAWAKGDEARKEEIGLLYAAHLLSTGNDGEARNVINTLIETPGRRKQFSAAAASLLIDAGKPAQAEELLLQALSLPEREEADSQRPRLRGDGSPGSTDMPLTPETLARMLSLKDQAPSPQNLRRNLVALVTHAWQLQGKNWGDLVSTVLPLVQPWHGEPYLAEMLQRVSATALAVQLYETAFKNSPADFELLKGYVDALTYANYAKGAAYNNVVTDVTWAVNRFVKARESDADAYRQAADYLMGKGFFAAAEKLFLELAETGQVNAAVALSLGRARVSLGRYDDALQSFGQAATLGGCSLETLELIGAETARVGREEDSLSLLRECAQRYPRDARLRFKLALRLYSSDSDKTREESLGEFKKAVALDESLVLNVATILVQDNASNALAFVRLLLDSRKPEEIKEGLKLGFQLAETSGDVELMKNLGARVSRVHRDNLLLLSELAGLYFKYNLPEQGIEKLKTAAAKGDPFFSLLLGVRLVTSGDRKEGLKQFNVYLEKDLWKAQPTAGLMPNDRYATFVAQVEFLADAGLQKESIKILGKTVERFPADHRLRLKLSGLLLSSGEKSKAIEHLVAACDTWPVGEEQTETRRILQVLRNRGLLDQALGQLEDRFATGGSPGAPFALAAGYAISGLDSGLARLLTRLFTANKLRPIKYLMLAQVLTDYGRYEEARRTLAHVLSRAWGRSDLLTPAHRMLCTIYSAIGKRELIDEATRMVLLQVPSDTEFRMEIAGHFFENEYAKRAEEQFNLSDLYEADNLEARTSLFTLYIHGGELEKARTLAFRTAFQGERVLNILLAFASVARKKLEFPLALELYEKAMELDPHNLPLIFAVAELALVTGNLARSRQAYQEYIGTGPGRAGRAAEVVQNAIKYGWLGLANAVAAQNEATGPQMRIQRGLALVAAGQEKEGKDLLLEAASLEETSSPLLLKMLSSHAHRPYLLPSGVADRVVNKACAGRFSPAECRFWDGVLRLRQGEPEAALKAFSEQLTGSSETWFYTIGAFRSLVRNGLAGQADSLIRSTMTGYRKEHVLNEAIKALFSVVEEPGLSDDARKKVGNMVLTYLKELQAYDPYDFWLQTQAAEIRMLVGDPDGATREYEEALKQSPWIAGLYNNLAYLFSQLNKELDRGTGLVEEALRREPGHSSFYLDTKGWLLYRKGELPEAEKLIRQSLARVHLGYGESLAESLYHLGLVLHEQGKNEEAGYYLGLAGFLDSYGRYGRMARELLQQMGADPFHLKL